MLPLQHTFTLPSIHNTMQEQQTQSQFKLLIKTSSSKLKFKLTKSRALSTHTIQTTILNELNNLAALPNESRGFERGLDILKMKLATLVRSDRVADVWEDLIGELAILESSIHTLPGMIEDQQKLNKEKADKLKREGMKKQKGKSTGWSFFGFGPGAKVDTAVEEPADETKPAEVDDTNQGEEGTENVQIDRLTKVIRNVVVAQEYLGDDIKELKKLALSLNHCIDKPYLVEHAPDKAVSADGVKLDLEDKIYVEIVRKLRGDDEESVINEYIKELAAVYRIDLYNEGKFEDEEESDGEDADTGDDADKEKPKIPKVAKKPLNEFDDLKQRFDALKKL